MTAQPGPRKRFERALESGSVILAMTTAAEIPNLSLDEALALCQLLSEKQDAAFERAAGRWVGRLAVERKLTLEQVELAVDAMSAIGLQHDDQGAEYVLLELLGNDEQEER